ncbi:MAG TPA: dienelactone hydrolase family protein [Acidimicrobiales bacterium]|nr:dienelactone hydrolase family protein [Acidimicrobiales bacterium]
MGEVVELSTHGSRAVGYLAAAGEGAGLGVVVVGESSGLSPLVRDVCDRFADEGFTALAPDLTDDPDTAASDLSDVVDHLTRHPAVRGSGVGVVGFGRGGGLALWLATRRPQEVRAVVPFYSVALTDRRPDWSRLEASVEGHYAEGGDAGFEAARSLEKELTDLGKDVRMFLYPGAAAGFFDDTRPDVHDADAARQAWVRTLEFLRAKLG